MTTVTRLLPLLLLLTLTGAACATRATGTTARGPVPRPFPGAPVPEGRPAPEADRPVSVEAPPTVADGGTSAEAAPGDTSVASIPSLVGTAMALRGVPYRNGGTTPDLGFDCSGFVQYVFARHGTRLPREVRDQFTVGEEIDLDDVQAGDLIFFETVSRGASHVGLAIGGDQFVHAPSSTGVVRVERFSSSYWERRIVGARRVSPAMMTRVDP
jgi:cell wall-associated NlpC family hydrolase